MQDDIQKSRQAAGKAAADLIKSGMLVGLGTGTTAAFFIESLIERFQNEHLDIKAFPSSERTAKLAIAGGIPLCGENSVTSLDMTIDGADEVDPQKRLIKGGGGALLREKIVASMSKELIIIIDRNKLVNVLGGCPLPIEIVPFAHHATLAKIIDLGYQGVLRLKKDEQPYMTDNGNYIIDITFLNRCHTPEKDQAILSSIPGVIETGFFFNMATKVIVGQADGGTLVM